MGRIKLRREGPWWVAYFGDLEDTGAAIKRKSRPDVELARVRVGIAEDSPTVKQAFIDLAKLIVAHAVSTTGGTVDSWNDPVPAPESERSGRA